MTEEESRYSWGNYEPVNLAAFTQVWSELTVLAENQEGTYTFDQLVAVVSAAYKGGVPVDDATALGIVP